MTTNKHEDLIDQHQPVAISRRLDAVQRTENISAAVLGAIDGCVTTFAVVSGAAGAGFTPTVAVVLGCANLLADGFSMAVSNYESIKAQREFVEETRRNESLHIDVIPEGEREEIRQIFRRKGFGGATLEEIVDTISADRRLWLDTMLTEEHGLARVARDPIKSAVVTFLAFLIVGAIPLLPFVLMGEDIQRAFVMSAVFAAVMFFGIGLLKSVVMSRPVWRSAIGTLLTGGAAASLAYLAGYVLRAVYSA